MNRVQAMAVIFLAASCGHPQVQRSQPVKVYNPCGKLAENGHGNVGLWDGKLSFRDTLTDAEWERFQQIVQAKHYDESCTKGILAAAITPQESGPLPLGLLLTATEFYLEKLGLKK